MFGSKEYIHKILGEMEEEKRINRFTSPWVKGFLKHYPSMDFDFIRYILFSVWKELDFDDPCVIKRIHLSQKIKILEAKPNKDDDYMAKFEAEDQNKIYIIHDIAGYCSCMEESQCLEICRHNIALMKKVIEETGTDAEKIEFEEKYNDIISKHNEV